MTIRCKKCGKTIDVNCKNMYYLVNFEHIDVCDNMELDKDSMQNECGQVCICPLCNEISVIKEIPSPEEIHKIYKGKSK